MKFYFQRNSVKNNLKYPKSLSHCLTELFTIYQNNNWSIRRWDDHTFFPSTHRIILKIVGFEEFVLILTKYNWTKIFWDLATFNHKCDFHKLLTSNCWKKKYVIFFRSLKTSTRPNSLVLLCTPPASFGWLSCPFILAQAIPLR